MGHGRVAVRVAILVALALGMPTTAGAVLPGPNGMIVFTSGRDEGLTPFDDAHAQLWLVAKQGDVPTRVTINAAVQHRHASWSPDRTKIAYAAGPPGNFDIFILDLTKPASGTNPKNITFTPGIAEDRAAWSPDGTRIAFSSNLGGVKNIFVESAPVPR